ncbi:MAG: methyltransferase [Actinobacteria bacterium]|nr:methyltransferase [Actinomycetota bacterium]
MNSKERIICTINHKQPDKLPVDFGSTHTTGIHVSNVYRLRQYYNLDLPGTPVKVVEPYQMLGEIADDLKDILGVDVAMLEGKGTFFGYKKENWKEWQLNDGTPVLVPGLFNTQKNDDGSIYQYAEGDKNYPPSSKMPSKGFFFDSIIRQKNPIEDHLNPEDNLEEWNLISKEELDYLKMRADYFYNNTGYGIMGALCYSGFGDIAFVPGPMLKDPKGIRDIEEWYISLFKRKDYIKKVFDGQLEIALENYKRINEALGDIIDVIFISGTDFGTQQGLFISLDTYRELFKPFYKKVNRWIHENTKWKTFIHSCGSVYKLIPDLIDDEFDILNPVQISASDMEPEKLKNEFGKYLVFWGGGVDTQKTLPLKGPYEIKEEVKRLIEIFGKNGGFVFNTIHNVQANVPIENLIAMFEVINEYRK